MKVDSKEAKEFLKTVEWEEGKIFPVAEGPYRHRIVAHCSENGRQKAVFANGEYPYFGYVELLSGNGEWIRQGNGIVPVLGDNRILMVVEQRPAQSRYGDRPTIAEVGGKEIDLRRYGPHSSLEFPGGAVDENEGLKMGALRELQEETGIGEQMAIWFRCLRPVYLFGSDIAIRHYSNVVYLPSLLYKERVETDGGLNVLALTEDEVETNIWRGVICSGQAALTTYGFFQEVWIAQKDFAIKKKLIDEGYLAIESVKIAKN